MLENFKQHGVRITYENKYMYYDDTWIVKEKRHDGTSYFLFGNNNFEDAFDVLLNG